MSDDRRATKGDEGRDHVVPSQDRLVLYVGLGAALIGALVLAGAVVFNARDVERQQALVPATGTVVEQRAQSYGTKSRVLLTLRFTTATGRIVDLERAYGSSDTTRPAKGDTVIVRYDPEDPSKAEVQDSSRLGYALVAAVGLGFLLVGLTLAVRFVRARRRRGTARG